MDDSETNLTSTGTAGPNSQTQVSDWKATAKDHLGVASRFTQTILKKLPECINTDPVKMAFSIAKVIIEIKDVGLLFLYVYLGDTALTGLTIISGGRRQ